MLASAGDDVRVWCGTKFDDLIKQYETEAPKVTSLAWNSNSKFIERAHD